MLQRNILDMTINKNIKPDCLLKHYVEVTVYNLYLWFVGPTAKLLNVTVSGCTGNPCVLKKGTTASFAIGFQAGEQIVIS